MKQNLQKIIFFDRDGTIIEDANYINTIEKIKFIPGAIEALKKLQEHFVLIMVTNQSGVGRGYYTIEDFYKVNNYVIAELNKNNVNIKETLFCIHSPEQNCECRKPGIKLVKDFLKKESIEINKNNSWMIGDKTADIKFGENLEIKTILLKTGKAGKDGSYNVDPDYIVESFKDVLFIIKK